MKKIVDKNVWKLLDAHILNGLTRLVGFAIWKKGA